MSRIHFASDFHLNHGNIASPNTTQWEKGFRNFDSVEHMNYILLDNINKHVAQDDTLYYHGDFCFGGHEKTPEWRRKIYCQNIHFIRGNHDNHIDKYSDYFSSVNDILHKTLHINGRKIPFVMCHYAMRIWQGSHKGFLHTYGHSHNSLERKPYGKSMDVGVDAAYHIFGEYRPFRLEEVLEILDKRNIEFPDHHSSSTNVK